MMCKNTIKISDEVKAKMDEQRRCMTYDRYLRVMLMLDPGVNYRDNRNPGRRY